MGVRKPPVWPSSVRFWAFRRPASEHGERQEGRRRKVCKECVRFTCFQLQWSSQSALAPVTFRNYLLVTQSKHTSSVLCWGGKLGPCRAVYLSPSKVWTVPVKPPKSSVWPHGLRSAARQPVLTRQPGGTATGDRIRALVLDSRSAGLAPLTEMAPDVRRPRPGHRRGH